MTIYWRASPYGENIERVDVVRETRHCWIVRDLYRKSGESKHGKLGLTLHPTWTAARDALVARLWAEIKQAEKDIADCHDAIAKANKLREPRPQKAVL